MTDLESPLKPLKALPCQPTEHEAHEIQISYFKSFLFLDWISDLKNYMVQLHFKYSSPYAC